MHYFSHIILHHVPSQVTRYSSLCYIVGRISLLIHPKYNSLHLPTLKTMEGVCKVLLDPQHTVASTQPTESKIRLSSLKTVEQMILLLQTGTSILQNGQYHNKWMFPYTSHRI